MTRPRVYEVVGNVLRDALPVEESEVIGRARLKVDLNMGSIDYVDVVSRFKGPLGISIEVGELRGVETVDGLVDYVFNKLEGRK